MSDDEDPDFEGLIFVTVPQPADDDGTTEWLIRGGRTKSNIFHTPGYPAPVPKARLPNMVIVKETAEMGMGLFATCDIKRGELVFAERPLLVSPCFIPEQDFPHLTDEADERERQLFRAEFESYLKLAFQGMSFEKQEAFMSLSNCKSKDSFGPLLGIFSSNGYQIDLDDDSESLDKYGAIGELAARINHSCRPNVRQEFDRASFSLRFYTKKDIKAGDELFYCYCNIRGTAAERQAFLNPSYGFVCVCPSCVNATLASDELHSGFASEASRLGDLFPENKREKEAVDRTVLESMIELEKRMIEEGLEGEFSFDQLLLIIGMGYKSLGMLAEGESYTKRCPKTRFDGPEASEDDA
ncbi:hypothetical protein CPB83DRAFT_846383 [Crepidotus variabilis]|uniref:SET domain-containing protein n=1 Tax=Crepidotus variabilis TaxID=179855 RepID=A0A9P6EQ11_9AGAR|nr:hypothetical protein CPB83DRAFT_846383 [Crepidotus variabilis]